MLQQPWLADITWTSPDEHFLCPCFCCSVAERAMQSLAEVAEVLLQYLEERQTLTGEGSDDTLAIAVTRALSRSEEITIVVS